MTSATPPPDLRARVLAAAASEPVPARSAGLPRQAAIVALGFAASIGLLLAIGGPGARSRSSAYYLMLAALWLGVTGLALWAGVARGRSMLGRPPWARAAVATSTPLALLATAALAGGAVPPGGEVAGVHEHVVCAAFTVLFALGPLAALAALRRRGDPVAPRLSGAAMGAAAGAWGAVSIELRCEHAQLDHVVLGHVLPVVALVLLGIILGDRVLALRARDH